MTEKDFYSRMDGKKLVVLHTTFRREIVDCRMAIAGLVMREMMWQAKRYEQLIWLRSNSAGHTTFQLLGPINRAPGWSFTSLSLIGILGLLSCSTQAYFRPPCKVTFQQCLLILALIRPLNCRGLQVDLMRRLGEAVRSLRLAPSAVR